MGPVVPEPGTEGPVGIIPPDIPPIVDGLAFSKPIPPGLKWDRAREIRAGLVGLPGLSPVLGDAPKPGERGRAGVRRARRGESRPF